MLQSIKHINLSSDPRKVVHLLLESNLTDFHDVLDDVSILGRLSMQWKKYDKKFHKRHLVELQYLDIRKHMDVIKSFANVRNAAILELRNDLINKLSLFEANSMCRHEGQSHDLKDIPYELFNWSFDAFLVRLGLPNLMSIDFLTKQIPMECLENLKFRSDLQQLIAWVQSIFYGEYCDDDEHYAELLLMQLQSECAYLNLHQTLQEQLNYNNERMRQNLVNLNKLTFNTNDPQQTKAKALLEEQLNNVTIWNPIELRYQRKWINSKLDQYELRAEMNTESINKEIAATTEAIGLSSEIAFLVQQATYKEVDAFRDQLENLKVQFEREVQEIDAEITYLRRDIHNLKESRRFQTEEIKRLREEIDTAKDIIRRELRQKLQKQKELEAPRKMSIKPKPVETPKPKKK